MIALREAGPDDAEAISALAREVQALHAHAHPEVFRPAGPDTFPAETIRALMAQPGHRFWIAHVDGAPAGYAYAELQRTPETPWHRAATVCSIEQMGVTAAARGHGAGTALVEAAGAFASAHGARELRLSVWHFNEDARAFYASAGFTPFQHRLWRRIGGDA